MTLLNPIALLYSLLIGVLLLVHFYRRSRRVHWVSNLQLWNSQGATREVRPILQRIKKNLLLILQILFVLAGVLALSRPAIRFWTSAPRSIVLVLDCSASMSAREGGKTRFELARAKAAALLDQVESNDRVFLVQARAQPIVDSYPGAGKNALLRALASITVTQAPADVYGAVILGLSAIPKSEPYQVFVFSDGTQAALLPESLLSERVHYIQTGDTGNNVGISRLAVRSNPFSAYDQEIYVEIANFSERAQAFEFELSLEGSILRREAVNLHAQERRSFTAEVPPGSSGVLKARIDVRDDLDADNQAYAVIYPRTISVLLGTVGNLFLEKALQVNPQVKLSIKRPDECSTAELQKPYDVIVLDGFAPPNLPAGNYLILSNPARAAAEPKAALRNVRNLVLPHPEHPIAAFVDPANIVIDEAIPLAVPALGTVLIEGMGKPLLTASEDGAARTVNLGFDIRASNLPLTVSFPVLISNILNWLSGAPGDPGNQVEAGAPLGWRIPADGRSSEAAIATPQGGVVAAPVTGGVLSFSGTEATGIYTVRCGESVGRFAVNLFSDAESRIAPLSRDWSANANVARQATLAGNSSEIWRLLLYTALAVLFFEWILSYAGNRSKEP
ncbi:MAG: BatA and WFA domain-containing protein [Acidobacteriota bacterium]|jgi:hypothetical protein